MIKMNISSNDEGGLRLENEYFNLSDLPSPLLSLLACREVVPAALGINLLHPDCKAKICFQINSTMGTRKTHQMVSSL